MGDKKQKAPPTVDQQLKAVLNAIVKLQDLHAPRGEKATALYRCATFAAGCATDLVGTLVPDPGVSPHDGDPPAS